MRTQRDRDAAREIAARRTRIERLGTDQAFDDLQHRSALAALDERRQLGEELDSIAQTLAAECRDAEADARALGRRPARSSRPAWQLGDDTPSWQLGADDGFEARRTARNRQIADADKRRSHHATSRLTAREKRSQSREAALVRARPRAIEMRAAAGDTMPTLFGHFAVFNVWTEVNSIFEGRFLERLAPGCFSKTLAESRAAIRCLFQHGTDPVVGDKPLGPFDVLTEDDIGLYAEVPLLDAGYVRDLVPGLEAGVYGASFRFRSVKEQYVEEPGASAANPMGLPERTVQECELFEAGPVTFGQYAEATSGVRALALTDAYLSGTFPAAVAA